MNIGPEECVSIDQKQTATAKVQTKIKQEKRDLSPWGGGKGAKSFLFLVRVAYGAKTLTMFDGR